MSELRKHIKKIVRELVTESITNDLISDALPFIREYLGITSNISLKHTPAKFTGDLMTQQMASVGFDTDGTFIVNVDFKGTKYGFVQQLAHELTHVKQIEDGRLKRVGNNVMFDGEIYTKEDYERMYHSDEIPKFEEEAFDNQRLISNLYWNRF